MKITSVEIFDCEANRNAPYMARFNAGIIRINTDEGISGLGEVTLAHGADILADMSIVRSLVPRIVGKDPMKMKAIKESLFRTAFWGIGGSDAFYAGISAIDLALWGIRAKANEKLRAHASQQPNQQPRASSDTLNMPTKAEQYAAAAKKAIAKGYTAIKVDPLQVDYNGGPSQDWTINHNCLDPVDSSQLRMGRARIAAVREAVGPDVDIIIEIHALLGTHAAIQFAHAASRSPRAPASATTGSENNASP